jgi:hypothetical protein
MRRVRRSAYDNCMSVTRCVTTALLSACVVSPGGATPGATTTAGDHAQECSPQFALLTAGSSVGGIDLPVWRKDQAGTWGGDDWLGWTYDGDALVPVTLIVQDLPKERNGPDEDDEVTVESIPEVPFAMRCIPVPTAHIRSAGIVNHDLEYSGPLRITLGDRRYDLRVRRSGQDLADAQIVLTDGRRIQVLYSTEGSVDEPHFEVNWAGDLDGDGELDLVVNLSSKYSWHPHVLLLSSMASGDEIVREAARLETGC